MRRATLVGFPWLAVVAGLLSGPLALLPVGPARGEGPAAPSEETLALGRELFARAWVPDDSRSRGGDGLGPVYNERSCLACHDQGGPGGGGAADKNIEIITGTG